MKKGRRFRRPFGKIHQDQTTVVTPGIGAG